MFFIKINHSAIGLALISKYKIISHSIIKVDKYDKYSRDILKVILSIENKTQLLSMSIIGVQKEPQNLKELSMHYL